MMDKGDIKKALFEECCKAVAQKKAAAKRNMEELQEDANNETKSSAGDKYETGRAMMHLEKDKYAAQLTEALKWEKVLAGINLDTKPEKAGLGSLVFTNQGIYFLSIVWGKITIHAEDYFVISLASPIGMQLKGKKTGDQFVFKGRKFEVLEIQ